MSPSRMLGLFGLLCAFAGGIAVGIFLASPPAAIVRQPPEIPAPVHPSASPRAASADDAAPVPSPEDSPGSMQSVKRLWANLNLADDLERHATWLAMLKGLSSGDAKTIPALLHAMRVRGHDPTFESDSFWLRWGAIDGPTALKSVADYSNGADTARVMRGWAQSNPEAARAWLGENPYYSGIDSAVDGFVEGYAMRDLDGATRYVLGRRASSGQPLLTSLPALIAAAVQQGQFPRVAQWFDTLPESRLKEVAFLYVAEQRVGGSLPVDWVASQAGKPWRDDGVIDRFASYLANNNPTRALAWVSALPPSPKTGQYGGIDSVVTVLSATHPDWVQNWLSRAELPPALKAQGQAAYQRHLQKTTEPTPTR
jgi:hypothetical protein